MPWDRAADIAAIRPADSLLPGQVPYHGQLGWVSCPGDQRPTRHTGDVIRDQRQLNAGILEKLLETLDLACAIACDHGAGPGQVAQLADRFRRDERATHEAMRPEISKPRRVRYVSLCGPADSSHDGH